MTGRRFARVSLTHTLLLRNGLLFTVGWSFALVRSSGSSVPLMGIRLSPAPFLVARALDLPAVCPLYVTPPLTAPGL